MPWQEKLDHYLTPKRQRFILIGLVVIYALLLTYKITNPFIGTSETFSGLYGIAAWNWVLHGPISLRFTMMTPYGSQVVAPEITSIFFLNHPSFFIAPTALIYWLLGAGEWQTRVSPIIFSLLQLVTFWFLIERVFKKRWLTVMSALFYTFFTMGNFYGRMLTHDPIALFFILALLLAVVRFEQEPRTKNLVLLCITVFLGGLSDWTFFLTTAAAWWYIVFRKNYPKKKLVLCLVIGILSAALSITLLQIWSTAQMNPFAFLKAVFINRNAGIGVKSIFQFFILRANFDLLGFSEVGLILAIIGAIYFFRQKDRTKILSGLLILAPGLLVYTIFYGHSTTHQFYGLYMMPGIALMAAWGLGEIKTARIASALFILFLASSLWYTYNLFSYQSFALDDFTMLHRVNAALSSSVPMCMGERAVSTNELAIKFDLFPREFDDTPCPTSDQYFMLRRPESYAARDPDSSLIQTFFNDTFWQNLHRISFAASLGMETVKTVPFLKARTQEFFAGDSHTSYPMFAKNIRDLVSQDHLKPIDCSTNFCLYKIQKVSRSFGSGSVRKTEFCRIRV